ncbi:hypothetical protein BSKO_03457 [Bryopsis sp. KO-2023]|nr:hypothetical protein BSKO_03457 [Bryopsis sp. KO-2023]
MAAIMKPLEQWTVVELRAELKSRGLACSGLKKAELLERLRGEMDKDGEESTVPSKEPSPGAVEEDRDDETGAAGERDDVANGAGESEGPDIVTADPRDACENAEEGSKVAEPVYGFELHVDSEVGDGTAVSASENGTGLAVNHGSDEEVDLACPAPGESEKEFDPSSSCQPQESDAVVDTEGQAQHGTETGKDAEGMDIDNNAGGSEAPQQHGEMGVADLKVERYPEGTGAVTGPSKTPEWQEFEIPGAWLPLPLIKVKNLPDDCQIDVLKEALCNAYDDLEIHSVHTEPPAEGAPPAALIRLSAPHLMLSSQGAEASKIDLLEKEEPPATETPAEDGGEEKPAAEKPNDPKTILEAAGELGDVKRIAEFCVQKLEAAEVKLGETALEFEAPILRTTLFIHNLRDEYGEEDEKLQTELAEHGEVLRCFSVRNKDGSSKDYGFVEYALPSDAAQAKNAVDNKSSEALQRFRDAKMNALHGDHSGILPEKRVRCEWAFNQTIPSVFSKICYISNLPVGFMDRDALRVVFQPYGEIVSCNIRSRAGMGPGCGFVEFSHGRDAEVAMLALNGTHNPNLGYILVSLVNPAKFPGDTASSAFQRGGVFQKRPRTDFIPGGGRGRGFGRAFMMDPRGGRSMARGRGRGGRGGPMQPQYAYNAYNAYYGGYQPQAYQQGYYGGGYQYPQQGGGYQGQYYQQQGQYSGQYRSGNQSPHQQGGYNKSSGYGQASWTADGSKNGSGASGYGYGAEQGYGQHQGYSGSGGYGSYSGYGSQSYGSSGYGSTPQAQAHGQYGGNSGYQSGYGSYQQGGSYQGQQGYGGSQVGYGGQDYGSAGYGHAGYDQTAYNAQVGDKRGPDYSGAAYQGGASQDTKRQRY